MKNLNTKITKHVNDVIQKHANSLFRNVTLCFYGIKTAPIKELINPELPIVDVSGGGTDMVFLLEDGKYLHFAFETRYSIGKLIHCAGYDLRLFARDGRKVHTVIIYSADVEKKPDTLDIGVMVYEPDVILMYDYDGSSVFSELDAKLKAGQELTDVDMLNLILLPLMKHTISRKELAVRSVELAQTIKDTTKRNACIAATFAFASKYLEKEEAEKLLEVIRLADLAVMLVEREVERKMITVAKNALRKGSAIDFVKDITDLDESIIKQLQAELDSE